eukprot:CAMPEP_0115189894 /NCGR_PEP_ID=MMETSP0270-20121206/11748_1 /TAXON_ID=71861 /ORGANISM="Scrippsiella trochoidea, Strain CCMP3099" /LENGTH=395 /DNA_ID=CAMNT_0002603095 /DNA_START=22 /DNA_END=1206 /DNA_ORIENTATION=-
MAPAKASIGTLHFIEQTLYKAEKALIAAKFNGLVLDKKAFDAQKDAKKPDFLAKNPVGKVPFLETDMGCIFTTNAIARYVARCRADTSLYGKSFDDECQIDTWLEFCTHEIEVPLMTWVYPVMGLMDDVPKATSEAQADVKKAFTMLENQLKASAYLVGDFITLADIAIVCALREGFALVFDPAFRKPFPKACAWFERCCNMPQFKSVIGDVKLCTAAQKPKPVIAAFAPPARGAAKDAAAKDAAPKAKAKATPEAKAQPKSQPKPAAAPAGGAAVSGDVEAQIKAVGDEIRTLKEKLKGEGLSGKKINDHAEVKQLVEKLNALKTAAPAAGAAPAAPAAPAAAPAGGDVEAQIKAVGDEIRTLKEKLKGEGLSGKKINDHAEVKRLVAQLQELK